MSTSDPNFPGHVRPLAVLPFLLAACTLGCSGDDGGSRNSTSGGAGGSSGSAGSAGKSAGGGGSGGTSAGGTSGGGTTAAGTGGGGTSAGGTASGGATVLPDIDWSTAPAAPVARTCTVTPTAAPAATWVDVTSNLAGMASECGNLTTVSADPCSNQVIAGIANAGLWATTDDGGTWTKLGSGVGSATITNRPTSFIYDPEDPAVFYESGIYNGGGVYKTTDNGVTFTQLGTIGHNDLVSVDFSDPERKTLLAGGHEQKQKLFLSTNGGAAWTDIGPNLPATAHFSTLPLVLDATHFLLGSCGYGEGECGVYLSADAGVTWGRSTTEAPAAQPLWGIDGTMYWSTIYDSGVITSADSGDTWSKHGGPHTAYPAELPDGRVVTIGQDHLIISSNGGTSWTNIGNTLPFKPAGVTYSPQTKTFYIWQWDCGNVVLNNAIASAGFDG